MPNWGEIAAWSELDLTLRGSAAATGAGGPLTYGYSATGLTLWAFNTVLTQSGIILTVESSFDGTSGTWAVSYDGPGAPFGGYLAGGTGYQDTEITAKIRGLMLYSQLTGALYNISCDGIDLYVNGAFEISLPGSGFNETSNGCGPCYITILGVPLQIEGGVSGGVDASWAYDPCDVSDVAGGNWNFEVDGAISGGWRFKEDGDSSWQTLPVLVDNRNAPSSGDCPYGLSTAGIVSCTNTYDAVINCFSSGSSDLDYRGRVNGQAFIIVDCRPIGDEPVPPPVRIDTDDKCRDLCTNELVDPYRDEYRQELRSESASGWICILPNLEKKIRRLGGASTKAKVLRFELPSVVARATRSCEVDALTSGTDAEFELYPGSLAFLAAMGLSEHAFEDFLALPTIAPTEASRSKSESVTYPVFYPEVCSTRLATPEECEAVCGVGGSCGTSGGQEFPAMPAPSSKSESVSYTTLYSVSGADNYQSHANPLLRYVGTWGNLLWHYPHFRDNYSDVDFTAHWGPARQQHMSNAGLPLVDRTNTRTDVIGSCFDDSGHTPFMDAAMAGQRWLGVSRPRLYSPTIPAQCQTGSDSVWNFGVYDSGTMTWDGVGSVGSGSVTIGTDTTKATLDVLSFSAFPFMYPLICDRIQIPASGFTNVDSFSVKLIGIDGSEAELCTVSGTHVIPKGPNTKYAGSWGIQNSPGGGLDDLGVDADANGISSQVMSDPLHCCSFSLLPARAYYRLRFDIVKTNPALDATVPHPIFKRNTTTPRMICESGHIQTIIWPNGSALRLGNWDFYIDGLGFQNPPAIKAFGKTTIIDALCTIRLIFEARAADDGLVTELSILFDPNEGQSIAVVDKNSVAWINPLAGQWTAATTFQWSLVNTMAESPPLSGFPNKSFEIGPAEWSQTGDYKHEVLEWSQEDRYMIHPVNAMHQLNASGSAQITTSVAGIPGWAITKHREPVDNLETPSWDIEVLGTKYADAAPWRGFFGICDIEVEGVAVWAHNLLSVFGFVHWVWASGSGVAHRRSNTSWPVVTDVDVMVSGDSLDACPVLRQNSDGRLFCLFVRGALGSRELFECYSDDDGATWTTPEEIGLAEYCYTFTDSFGYEGRAKFVFDSGSSGPGKISVQTRGPGETAFGSWVQVAVSGSPVLFAEGSFGIVAAEDAAGHWILTAVNDGDSEPTNYASTDEAKTWKLA